MNKKIMRKRVLFFLSLLFVLSACANMANNISEENVEDSGRVENRYQNLLIWNDYEIQIEGENSTEDNPWGSTAGVIENEGVGSCVFLTPNTGFTILGLSENSIISLQAELHPWVAEASDGAGIDVWIMNDSDDILQMDSILIEKNDDWKKIQYSLSGIKGASKIKFLCNNGAADDDSADWVILKKNNEYLSNFGKEGYVRSANYFGNEWPVNFWNSELETLDKDFQQIRNDGFDSIILVIPWKEFQVSTDPITYSEYAFNNLTTVMSKAQDYGLDVYTRIGYTWDFYNDINESITDRYFDILRRKETHDAWLDYCKTLNQKLSAYPNFKDGFLTWEDFWGLLAICDIENEALRIEYANSIGYQNWVERNYTIKEYNNEFGVEYQVYSEIPVPYKSSDAAMEAFYQFYDEYMNSILKETQKVFPNISMEVRMDWDVYQDSSGKIAAYAHTATYSCEDSDYTATMYGIPMGFENKGERVSAKEAMAHTDYILANLINQNGGKPVYIEQFLFLDNTPQFSYNAQIKEEEVGKYLEGVAEILLKYSKGYGIWTYKDYRNNMLYNSQFALSASGWKIVGSPDFVKSDKSGSMVCHISTGDSLSQGIPVLRNHFNQDEFKFTLEVVQCDLPGNITIKFGNESQTLKISDIGKYELDFDKNDSFDFSLIVEEGEFYFDNLCIYSFVQEGFLYGVDGSELKHISDIRILNDKLSKGM